MIMIYKITNRLNHKLYVGQTRQPIEKRFLQHSKTNSPLGNAMRNCSLENFTIEIIEECETQEQPDEHECFWIKVLNCKMLNGYNQRKRGACGRHKNLKSNSDVEKISVGKIGDNIKKLRLRHNLSQAELANVAGVLQILSESAFYDLVSDYLNDT